MIASFVHRAAVACALVLPVAAVADTPKTAPAALRPPVPVDADPKLVFEKYTLPNGLEVILSSDKSVPLVAVNVWYHVGSGHETYRRSGFAHLFEHMMFQGSKHVGDDAHFKILKTIGAENVNGTTNDDRTNYYEVVPSHQLETALWLESDRMGYMLDTLTEKSFRNQVDVVRNERRQNYDNRPYGKALFAIGLALYPEGHPYRYLGIGRHEDLEAASVEDVKNFFRTWYVPANATLTVVGDFDMEEGKKLVAKWFGGMPSSKKPVPVTVPAPATKASETVVSDDFAKLRQISFVWHSPAHFADGDAELNIVANALAREGTGRLYRELVYSRPLAQSVAVGQSGSSFSGQFEIQVTLRSEADLAEVKRIVMEQVAALHKTVLTDKEIARVVAANEASAIRRLESVFGRSQAMQQYNHYLGDPNRLTWDLDRYRKTSAEKIRATVASYLVPDRMVTVITMPKSENKP
ncbi:MAG: M16 family metallopeptidase [Kofleriaceae bacterium]